MAEVAEVADVTEMAVSRDPHNGWLIAHSSHNSVFLAHAPSRRVQPLLNTKKIQLTKFFSR